MLVFDSETWAIIPGLVAPPAVCFSFASEGLEPWLLDARVGAEVLEETLANGEVIVGHFVAFDFGVLCALRPDLIPAVFHHYDKGLVRCTKIRQRLIDIEAGCDGKKKLVLRGNEWVSADYSLAGSGKGNSTGLIGLYAGKDRSKDKGTDSWRLRYGELDGISLADWPEEAARYAKEDAEDTLTVYLGQGGGVLVNEVEQVKADFVLHLASTWGMRTDGVDVAYLETWARAEWKKVQEKLLAEGIFRIQPLSAEDKRKGREVDCYVTKTPKPTKKNPKPESIQVPSKYTRDMAVIQAKTKAALEAQGLKVVLTPTRDIKTDVDCLEMTGDPLLMELADVGPVATVLKTFLPTLRQGTEVPINTRFETLLETGRISSSKPNLNNLPRSIFSEEQKNEIRAKYREATDEGERSDLFRRLTMGVRESIVPRPGHLFVSVDYDCAELRSLSQVCLWMFGQASMAKFFQEDPHGDPHLALAASILNIAEEEAKKRKNAGDPEVKGVRQMCKAVNFGLPGGLGPDKLVESARKGYGVIMSRDEAVKRKNQWFQRWPEMRLYLAEINRIVGVGGATVMQFRPGNLPHRKRGNVGYCDGANGFFQGLTADGAKEALWLVSKESYTDTSSVLFGSRVVGFLYDELIAEVPVGLAHEAAFRLRDLMVLGMQAWTPDIPATATPALMDRWHKNAEAVYDRDGKLIPWRPELKLLAA